MNFKKSLGLDRNGNSEPLKTKRLNQYINLKLASLNQPTYRKLDDSRFLDLASDLIKNHKEKNRLLANYLCPADQRIQNFIDQYLSEFKDVINLRLPSITFILESHGLARALSVPPDRDDFVSDIISSYRIKQGILHNPKNDRRTTKGVFHIAEGGLPIPDDKKSVPKKTFAYLLESAMKPPKELLQIPYTASQEEQAELFLSLLLRPIVSPEVPGILKQKSMEIRFFAPGNLVSNLDFVESIFGNAGDPYLPENDAALDIEGWTGHTGCIILAPHLTRLKKKDVGLPHTKDATERQKRDGMCYESEDEVYNDGSSFKITARTDKGIILTLIADNYFGYSKKEVKTQISYSANLFGNVEEEHAGGSVAFPSYNLGDGFKDDNQIPSNKITFDEMINMFSSFMELKNAGYAIDKNYDDIIYVPEDSAFNMIEQKVSWIKNGKEMSVRLSPLKTYILPSGYKIKMEKNPFVPSWRLVGISAEGTFLHKPCTVSGGGKSEISKSITDAIIYGPFFIADFEKDFDKVEEIINKDYSDRYKVRYENAGKSRPILSPQRSLGSVIKLLTPSPSRFQEEYNNWLESIPYYIKGLVYLVKRFYRPEWGDNWREYFSVDIIDGKYGNELKFKNRKLVASYLRIGLQNDSAWRTFKLRQDFISADKIQMEDDITASTVLPLKRTKYLSPDITNSSVKFTQNCEYRFFQRPDEAINRGFDKQAESDIASANTFISNFAALTKEDAIAIKADAIEFDKYTTPIKKLIEDFIAEDNSTYLVSSSHPRIFEGKPSKNMRYLQNRPDLIKHKEKYISEIGIRLFRKIPVEIPITHPVNTIFAGRRNNPPETGVRSLAVYNPIHFQELPELFMDFICSLTGKSPSTTGAGSEGALTKGPFNALTTITDLNNALVSFILTGYDGYTSAAGFIGPKYRVDHDISLLVPELWSRLRPDERDHKFLTEHKYLEKLEDFEFEGKIVFASRLGYRITQKFARTFLGRVFENPDAVFNDEILKPELQSLEVFVDGINNIVEAQQRVALLYFNDGSINAACPPLKAILNIMAYGSFEGKDVNDQEIRKMFTKDELLKSDWYKERLLKKQMSDVKLWQEHLEYVTKYYNNSLSSNDNFSSQLKEKIKVIKERLSYYQSYQYLNDLEGHLGLDPLYKI